MYLCHLGGDRPATHVHAAVEPCALGDDNAFGGQAAVDLGRGGQLDSKAGGDRAFHRALYDDLPRANVGGDGGEFTNSDRGVWDVQVTFDRTVDAQILVRGELAVEGEGLADVCHESVVCVWAVYWL